MRAACIGSSILLSAMIFSKPVYAQLIFNGKNEYFNHCASCHGIEGKGDGPVAKALDRAPTDLTKLSEANDGVFPSKQLYDVIDGRREIYAHGTRDMPVWDGTRDMPVWGLAARVSPAMTRARIRAVVDYLATLQGK